MKRYILLVVSLVTLSCSFLHAHQVLKGRNGNIVVKNDSLLRAMTAFTIVQQLGVVGIRRQSTLIKKHWEIMYKFIA